MSDGKRTSAVELAFDAEAVQEALNSLHIGLSVFDADLRLLACNQAFFRVLDFPVAFGQVGTPLEAFVRYNTERGNNGAGSIDALVRERLAEARRFESKQFRLILSDDTIVEVVRRRLPSGGVVSTYTDVTEITRAREALEEKEQEMLRQLQDLDLERQMVEQQAQQMVHMAEDLAVQNKEIEKSRVESDFQAKHDALTGLPNRRYFLDHLEQLLAAGGPAGIGRAVLFIDLDNFKPVNDVLGHDAGDRTLCEVARRLTSTLRDSDFVARLGGDEFAVIAGVKPENGRNGVRRVAERLLEALNIAVDDAEPPIAIAASIGVAIFPDDARDDESLLREADRAMYEAKASGRNRVVFAGDLPQEPAAPPQSAAISCKVSM